METGNGSVNYTVKELIARVDSKLDTVLAQISTKAEKSDVLSLDSRISNIERIGSPHIGELRREVEKLESRIAPLEKSTTASDALKSSYKWMFTLAAGNVMGLITLALKLFHII